MSILGEINSYDFLVNSLSVRAKYYKDDIDNIFIPLLKRLSDMREKKEDRLIVYLAASPGVGKSTLASFLEYLSITHDNIKDMQAIGIDGFHYKQEYIINNSVKIEGRDIPMTQVKGCPETFDLYKLNYRIEKLTKEDVMWPIYDRKIHDVVDDMLLVNKDIVIIEGNWLLQNEDGWRDLINHCDYSIFISSDKSILKKRLIDRKIKGGLSKEEAEEFYKRSDSKNIDRVFENHLSADLNLHLDEKGKYFIRGSLNE